ncbi:hypothetical protein OsJ_07324 [Oryza sativa Japonica Group]|uniref:Uncharacterized protein n=1 Tax=Oryza sativa subsp. japonica TaxID=39947 RepID=A3A8I7_ORYSJ|nr:hypothetical protein OsJ_07324 [Oryza sativa Japonica Group]
MPSALAALTALASASMLGVLTALAEVAPLLLPPSCQARLPTSSPVMPPVTPLSPPPPCFALSRPTYMRGYCFGKLRDWLEELRYRDGDTLFGAPYDFRYAPPVPGQTSEVYSRYFDELMAPVEAATKKKRKKAVIVGHSYGGMVAVEFIPSTPRAWQGEHIERLILVAPTLPYGFLGSVGSSSILLLTATSTARSVRPMWRSFESAMANFPSPAVFGREPLVITKKRNYSAYVMEDFLAAG